MILTLKELVDRLQTNSVAASTRASDALWIRFGAAPTHKTVDYRTSDGNTILHVYLGEDGSLVGVEIFP